MGLVGESGSGKTTMATALMRLTRPPAYITAGQIILDGKDLMALSNQGLQRIRLKEIALMPQAAMNSLNPVVRVGPQLKDGFKAHYGNISQEELDEKVVDILQKVGLRREVVDRYPHQLSGGMKQRVAMAIAISLEPKVIIADEPTSALDVVVQKQVMLTLSRLQQELGAAVLLIGHDMGLITQFADTIGVLYAGKLVERGAIGEVLDRPYHPYSRLLIDSLPSIDGKHDLIGIPGLPPELLQLPSGCAFHPRCPFAMEVCHVEIPVIQSPENARYVACHLYPRLERLPSLSTISMNLAAPFLSRTEG
jgi:peptide/nickel transport system ATP-binding protein